MANADPENVAENQAPMAPNPFPVEWDSPEEAQAMWLFDIVHCPVPLSRLDYELRMRTISVGANRVYHTLGIPIEIKPKLIHGFIFQRVIPASIPVESFPGAMKAADAAVRLAYQGLAGSWEKTWLPEVQTHLAAFTSFNLSGADWATLCAHLNDLKGRIERLWELHNTVLTLSLVALLDFEEAYCDLFPDAKPLDVYDLLAGFPNKTTEANIRLWGIGRIAASNPTLRAQIIEGTPAAVLAGLPETPEGRALREQIQDYGRTYGERNDDLFIDTPTWVDDPTPMLRGLREAVLRPERELGEELQRQAKHRETRLAEVRELLASQPRAVQDEFESLLSAAQVATVLTEDHHFWIDCKVTYHARRLSLEIGRRLTAVGALERPDDVFQLGVEEITGIGDAMADAAPRLHTLIAERRAEAERFKGVTPPSFLGVPSPLVNLDSAIIRVTAKFNGNLYGPPAAGGDLTGMAGSRGKVTGPARVIRTLEEASTLQPGDILVAAFTLPSWTPFFASVAAVVTNIGGILCHAAVVAREYGIPAVVGTRTATQAIRNGQIIEVDGDAGVVRLPTT